VEEKGESAGDLMTESTSDRKHLEAAELAQTLLAGLPYDYRQALVLRTDGMSYEEIAATMNCSLDAVKSRLKRGRKMVAGKMRRLMPSDDVNGAAKAGEPHEA
jgi:RNA polymerase sigma factor (sigma-70 family)